MPFAISINGQGWYAYECAPGFGRFETREEVEAEIRRLQEADLRAAEADLRISREKLERAKQRLANPAPIHTRRAITKTSGGDHANDDPSRGDADGGGVRG